MTMLHVLVDHDRYGQARRVRIFSDTGVWTHGKVRFHRSKVREFPSLGLIVSGSGAYGAVHLFAALVRKAGLDFDTLLQRLAQGRWPGWFWRRLLSLSAETVFVVAGVSGRRPAAIVVSNRCWQVQTVGTAYLQPADDDDLQAWNGGGGLRMDDNALLGFIERQREKTYPLGRQRIAGAVGSLEETTVTTTDGRVEIVKRLVRTWERSA